MIEVVATWLLAAVVVLGFGLPVGVRLSGRGPAAVRCALWIGLFAVTMLVAGLNVFAPLRSGVIAVGLVVLAAAGVMLSWRRLRHLRWSAAHAPRWWSSGTVVMVVVAALCWAVAAQRAPSNYDTGLYHLGAIAYSAQVGTVPGLANLFVPLGFGNVMVPLSAAATNGPLGVGGFAAVNSFLLLLLPIDLLLRFRQRRNLSVGSRVMILAICAIYPPMMWMADTWVTSPTSDTAVLVLTVAGVAALTDAVWRGRCRWLDACLVLAPLSIAAAMRPQAWVMVGVTVMVLLVVQWRVHRSLRGFGSSVGPALIFPMIALAVGAARDAALSGWWLYPLNRFPLPVAWRAEDPTSFLNVTLGIARDPGPGYQQAAVGLAWIPGWVARLPTAWELWVLGAMVVVGALLLITSRSRVRYRALGLAVTPGVVAAGVWFLASPPSFRFGWGPLVSVAAVLLAWGWMGHRWVTRPLLIVGGAGVLAVAVATLAFRIPGWPTEVPTPRTIPIPSDLGLVAPVGTDQCWRVFPLCTPAPAPGLELRGAEWREGFWRGDQAGQQR